MQTSHPNDKFTTWIGTEPTFSAVVSLSFRKEWINGIDISAVKINDSGILQLTGCKISL